MVLDLLLPLVAAMALTQLVLLLLARGLGLGLSRQAMACGLLLPLLVLMPWLDGDPLLVPCNVLASRIPDLDRPAEADPHRQLNDVVHQFLPWEMEVRRAFGDGRLPLWSDTLEGGSSPWVNPQAGVLSPIAMTARIMPLRYCLLGMLVLKILVAFQGTWLLARITGSGRTAALLVAACFAAGGGILSWALFPHTRAAAWCPWLVLAVIRLVRRPALRMATTTAVIVAFVALAGHPEVATGAGLAAAAIGLALRSRRVPMIRSLAFALLAAVLGFGLAAPQLVPFLRAVPLSGRAVEGATRSVAGLRFEWLDPSTWLMTPRFLTMPLNPYTYGTPYAQQYTGPFSWPEAGAGYSGLLVVAGLGAALAARRFRRVWPFAAGAAICFVLSARPLPLLLPLAGPIPFLKALAYQRLLLIGSLCLCVAAAPGVGRLLQARRRVGLWIGLVVAAAASILLAPTLPVLLCWALIGAAVAITRTGRTTVAVCLLAAAVLVDLVPWGRHHLPRGRPELLYPQTGLTSELARVADPHTTRVVATGRLHLYPNLLPAYGVADARPHNPMAPAGQLDALWNGLGFGRSYFSTLPHPDHPLLDFLNVGFVVAPARAEPIAGLKPAAASSFGGHHLWRNTEALPRWFITRDMDVIEQEQLGQWIAAMSHPRRVAMFSHQLAAAGLPSRWRDGPPAEISRARSSPGAVELILSGHGGGILATSLPFPQGWSATINGQRLCNVTINAGFFGAVVPDFQSPQQGPGTHHITLRFVPPGLMLGWVLFLLAAASAVLLVIRDRRSLQTWARYSR